MDLISSIIGVLYCTFYEMLYRKSFLLSREKNRNQIFYWYILILFRKNFKNYIKDLGLNPWKYPSIDDLKKIRVTNKYDLVKYFPSSSDSWLLNFLSIKMSSSGSTGTPFQFKIFILQWIEE